MFDPNLCILEQLTEQYNEEVERNVERVYRHNRKTRQPNHVGRVLRRIIETPKDVWVGLTYRPQQTRDAQHAH